MSWVRSQAFRQGGDDGSSRRNWKTNLISRRFLSPCGRWLSKREEPTGSSFLLTNESRLIILRIWKSAKSSIGEKESKMGKLWTSSAFTLLYEELTKQFPYHTWEKTASPGHGRDGKYREFCEMFARMVEAKGWKAVPANPVHDPAYKSGKTPEK